MGESQLVAFSLLRFLASIQSAIYALLRRIMLWILSAGPIPEHIGIIMDGNRRFADRRHMDRRSGHLYGYERLMHILKDCFDLKVKTVTLYAFSIDNFKRSPEEVSALMELMQGKLETLIEKENLVKDHGVRVRVLGDLALLPEGVRNSAERAMAITRNNNSAVLNLCIAYTSTQEIVHSIQSIRDNLVSKLDKDSQLTESQKALELVQDGEGPHAVDLWNRDKYLGLRKRSLQFKPGSSAVVFPSRDKDFCTGCCRDGVGGERQQQALGNVPGNQEDEASFADVRADAEEGHTKKMTAKDGQPSESDLTGGGMVDCQGLVSSRNGLYNNSKCSHHYDSANELLNTVMNHVTEDKIEQHLYTASSPPPDIIIRTSGETRLSNFLLWQASFSHLAFCKVLWPEFSFRHLCLAILEYQRAYPSLLGKQQLCNRIVP